MNHTEKNEKKNHAKIAKNLIKALVTILNQYVGSTQEKMMERKKITSSM